MTKPLVHCDKMSLARRVAEECHPTDNELIDFADHLFKTYSPVAPGYLLKTLFCTLQ